MIAPPPPRANPILVGHADKERILRLAAQSRRLHHAWLLTGAEGIGKSTLAFRFARALLAGFPGPGLQVPPSHAVFAQVAAGTHPDLVTVARAWDDKKQRMKSEIPIEDTRALLDLFAMTPAEAGWRIVVVESVESLNRNAANALLKWLEEPPQRAVFLLTSASAGRIQRTIRSRCACLPLRPLNDQDMATALRLFPGIGDDRLPDLIAASAGSPGKAVERAMSAGAAATSDLSQWQSTIHRELVAAGVTGRQAAGVQASHAIETRCEAWSTLLRLSAATEQFNLDRQQLALEAARLTQA